MSAWTRRSAPNLAVGGDAYYKLATDQLDDGQFGQAVVLTQFNYARGYSEGLEFKAKYQNEGFPAYANFSTDPDQGGGCRFEPISH